MNHPGEPACKRAFSPTKAHRARLGERQTQNTNTAKSSLGAVQRSVFMNVERTAM